uniref:Uncharacterized protein n=1 Tax=Oryza punctata TaxID=4537 RepID=A0A0E0LNL4_ORYPU
MVVAELGWRGGEDGARGVDVHGCRGDSEWRQAREGDDEFGYNEFMFVFENNREAINRMPRSLMSAFDNRSWIPVTNILFQLCKGLGFASSKNVESSSSAIFQVLLRETCTHEE